MRMLVRRVFFTVRMGWIVRLVMMLMLMNNLLMLIWLLNLMWMLMLDRMPLFVLSYSIDIHSRRSWVNRL